MKLIKINHERCGEPALTVYMGAKDNITAEQLDKDLKEAETRYWDARKDRAKKDPKPEYKFNISDYPETMTLKEIKEKIAEGELQVKLWQERQNKIDAPFTKYMEALGYKCLWDIQEPDIINGYVNWGHKHGQDLQMHYKNLDPDFYPDFL